MIYYETRGREINFSVKIENLTTDGVTGAGWSGSAYGDIIYGKASADNLAYDFFPTSIAVQLDADGVIDFGHDYQLVQNKETGFAGILNPGGNTLKVGSIIVISGYFVRIGTDVDAKPRIKFNDNGSLFYGQGGDGNIVGSTLNGTKQL